MKHAPTVAETYERRKPKPRGATLHPGIVGDARTLGCSRVTLYRMLTGEWKQLRTLRRRYDELKRQQAAEKQAGLPHSAHSSPDPKP